MELLTVSIVSYKNNRFLFRCLESIYCQNRDLAFEVFVVALFYKNEDIIELKNKYPHVTILEINEYCGFSENHNLVFRQANGDVILVLNDDTYFVDDSLTVLCQQMRSNKAFQIMSPVILNVDGTIQFKGRPKFDLKFIIKHEFHLRKNNFEIYKPQTAVFKTENVSGACFAIRKDVLVDIGYFDEYYYFAPEDVALSMEAARKRYGCYVHCGCIVYHDISSSTKAIRQVVLPVSRQGYYHLFNKYYGLPSEIALRFIYVSVSLLKAIYWSVKKKSPTKTIMLEAYKNLIKYSFLNEKPKDIFLKLFLQMNSK